MHIFIKSLSTVITFWLHNVPVYVSYPVKQIWNCVSDMHTICISISSYNLSYGRSYLLWSVTKSADSSYTTIDLFILIHTYSYFFQWKQRCKYSANLMPTLYAAWCSNFYVLPMKTRQVQHARNANNNPLNVQIIADNNNKRLLLCKWILH